MKKADIYLRDNSYFVQCVSRLTTGMWAASDPVVMYRKGEPGIYQKLLTILGASKSGIEPGKANKLQPLLEVSGLASWEEFITGAKYVVIAVTDDSDEITFYPTIQKSKEHFSFDSSLAVSGTPRFDTDLTELLDQAFSKCRNAR